jgi:hypothetical protein
MTHFQISKEQAPLALRSLQFSFFGGKMSFFSEMEHLLRDFAPDVLRGGVNDLVMERVRRHPMFGRLSVHARAMPHWLLRGVSPVVVWIFIRGHQRLTGRAITPEKKALFGAFLDGVVEGLIDASHNPQPTTPQPAAGAAQPQPAAAGAANANQQGARMTQEEKAKALLDGLRVRAEQTGDFRAFVRMMELGGDVYRSPEDADNNLYESLANYAPETIEAMLLATLGTDIKAAKAMILGTTSSLAGNQPDPLTRGMDAIFGFGSKLLRSPGKLLLIVVVLLVVFGWIGYLFFDGYGDNMVTWFKALMGNDVLAELSTGWGVIKPLVLFVLPLGLLSGVMVKWITGKDVPKIVLALIISTSISIMSLIGVGFVLILIEAEETQRILVLGGVFFSSMSGYLYWCYGHPDSWKRNTFWKATGGIVFGGLLVISGISWWLKNHFDFSRIAGWFTSFSSIVFLLPIFFAVAIGLVVLALKAKKESRTKMLAWAGGSFVLFILFGLIWWGFHKPLTRAGEIAAKAMETEVETWDDTPTPAPAPAPAPPAQSRAAVHSSRSGSSADDARRREAARKFYDAARQNPASRHYTGGK